MDELKEKIIKEYRVGKSIKCISETLNIPLEEVESILKSLKDENRYKRTFTDYFKKIIAERDMSDISRRQISLELGINANTVKRACEDFGIPFKEVDKKDRAYKKIYGDFSKDLCASCNSENVRLVDDDSVYCFDCGDEYIFKNDHILQVRWEYID